MFPFGTVVNDTWWPGGRLILVVGDGTGVVVRDAQAPVGAPVEFDPGDPRIRVVDAVVPKAGAEFLFVGGPADGKRYWTRGAFQYRVPVMPAIPAVFFDEAGPEPPSYEIAEYEFNGLHYVYRGMAK